MSLVTLPTVKDKQRLPAALTWLQILLLTLFFCWLYSGLPHAISQGTQERSKSAAARKTASDSDKSTPGTIPGVKSANAFSKPYGYYLNPILVHIQANHDQQEKITAIVQSYRGRVQPLVEEYKQKNQEFLTNVAHGHAPEVIMDEQTHIGRLYSDITLVYCQMSLEVRKVLTPEQIVQYEEFKRQQGWTSNSKSQTPAP